MNYWPAEITNLPECFLPLSDFIGRLAVNGAQTAKVNYGINRGWLAHHNSDVWAQTAPTGGYDSDPKGAPRWSCWPMAGVWLCQHLWEHYAFGGDKKYLSKTAYPLMKGAAEFLLQWLQKDPETGYWITNPSTSPENRFRYIDKEGKKQNGEISRSSGMDLGLAWDLLTNCIEASTVLDTDKAFRQQCMDVRANLQPFRIGSKGQLLEWDKEFEAMYPICSPCTPDDRLSPNSSRNWQPPANGHSKSAETAAQAGLWHGKLTSGHVCATVIMLSGC